MAATASRTACSLRQIEGDGAGLGLMGERRPAELEGDGKADLGRRRRRIRRGDEAPRGQLQAELGEAPLALPFLAQPRVRRGRRKIGQGQIG